MPNDYYELLDINRNATLLEIKKAFRKKALVFHPDKNKSAEAHEIFIKLNQAYEILSHSVKRKKYDNLLNSEKGKYSQRKEQQWEQAVKDAEEKGKETGEKYAQDFDYFSKRVLKNFGIAIFIEVIASLIFGEIEGFLFGFLISFLGILLFFISIESFPVLSKILGVVSFFLGLLIIRNRYLEIVDEEN